MTFDDGGLNFGDLFQNPKLRRIGRKMDALLSFHGNEILAKQMAVEKLYGPGAARLFQDAVVRYYADHETLSQGSTIGMSEALSVYTEEKARIHYGEGAVSFRKQETVSGNPPNSNP